MPAIDLTATAHLLLDLINTRAATLGEGRLLCIDGPAGSGKTSLAAAVAALAPGTRVVHMDDLYDGWDGLPRVGDQLASLLGPLAHDADGRYRRYDWVRGEYAEWVAVAPAPLLVLEGVGSGTRAHAPLATLTAWVSAPEALRLERGLARDGQGLQAQWQQWSRDEDEHFAREAVAERADVVVDGTGLTPAVVRPAGSQSGG